MHQAATARDDAIDGWLSAMWAQPAQCFTTPMEGAQIACRGWNLDATERPGIVLVHGFLAHAQWWDHIGPALADRYRVVALSLSGMGDSDRRPAYARAQHGREILAAAQAAGIERPIVIAHSYGAMAGLIAARAHPEAMRRIIVLDSRLPLADEVREQMPAKPGRVYPDRESALARFRLMPPGGWPHPRILRYIADRSVMPLPDGGWGWKFDATMTYSLSRETFREAMLSVPVPGDIVYGDRTEVFAPERRAIVQEILPNCGPFIELPACHHHLMIEQPIALVAALKGLLAREGDA